MERDYERVNSHSRFSQDHSYAQGRAFNNRITSQIPFYQNQSYRIGSAKTQQQASDLYGPNSFSDEKQTKKIESYDKNKELNNEERLKKKIKDYQNEISYFTSENIKNNEKINELKKKFDKISIELLQNRETEKILANELY